MFLKNIIICFSILLALISENKNFAISKSNHNNRITCITEIRAGFDIGSGSTKLQVASVKNCKNGDITIEKLYFKENINVQYSAALTVDASDPTKVILPDNIIDEGYIAMTSLKNKALEKLGTECGSSCTISSWRGIMTAAFRKAHNWQQAQNKLSRVAKGLIIKRLSQEEEALYGFYPVLKIKGIDPQNTVVWDMGGGSTQITAFDNDFKINNDFTATGAKVLETAIGSGTFEKVLKEGALTFNPVETKLEIAMRYIDNAIRKDLQSKPEMWNNFHNLFVNGKKYFVIGGILSRAIPAIVKTNLNEYNVLNYNNITDYNVIKPIFLTDILFHFSLVKNLSDLELKEYALRTNLMSHAELNDPKNASRYKSIAANLLLTKTYMESFLAIPEIYPVVIDGTDTLMLSPKFADRKYWKIDKISGKYN